MIYQWCCLETTKQHLVQHLGTRFMVYQWRVIYGILETTSFPKWKCGMQKTW